MKRTFEEVLDDLTPEQRASYELKKEEQRLFANRTTEMQKRNRFLSQLVPLLDHSIYIVISFGVMALCSIINLFI